MRVWYGEESLSEVVYGGVALFESAGEGDEAVGVERLPQRTVLATGDELELQRLCRCAVRVGCEFCGVYLHLPFVVGV